MFKIKKIEHDSNPISCPELEYLSGLLTSVNLTAPNKQSFRAKKLFNSRDHASTSWAINKFTKFL